MLDKKKGIVNFCFNFMFDFSNLYASVLSDGLLKGLSVFFWFVVIIIPLVIIHELGHLSMARLFKVRVSEFGIGIPPRTPLYFIKKGIVWSLNWIPFGGFAKIYGDHDALDNAQDTFKKDPIATKEKYIVERFYEVMSGKELEYILNQNGIEYDQDWQNFNKNWGKKNLNEEQILNNEKKEEQLKKIIGWEMEAKINSKEAFFNRGFFPKLMILLGGVLFNFLAAWLIIFTLLNFNYIQKNDIKKADDRIVNNYQVINNSLKETIVFDKLKNGKNEEILTALGKAGLKNGDKIITVGGREITSFNSQKEFSDFIQQNGNKPININYSRDGQKTENVEVVPEQTVAGKYSLGMALVYNIKYKAKNFASSFAATNQEFAHINKEILHGLKRLGQAILPGAKDRTALQEVSGPIGVGGVGAIVYKEMGLNGIFYIMALISLGLAITNLIPMPALDGGRILIIIFNKLTGKRNKKIESILIGATFLIMLLLILMIAIKDIGFVKNLK